jgi:predicted nucleic acid-binding protein
VTFFIDANVLIYAAGGSDYAAPCQRALTAVACGEADGRTSTAVLEEVWHIELSTRLGGGALDGITERAYRILSPLLSVTDEVFNEALTLPRTPLGANDRIHAATCLANGISHILTADRGFDSAGRLRRVDPLDEAGVKRLLGAGVKRLLGGAG